MFDLEDRNDFNLTLYDIERLKDLEINESFEPENGLMIICRYKTSYMLIFTCLQRNDMREFKTIQELLYFLKEIC